MALSYEVVMEMLGDDRPLARRLDPAGTEPLRAALSLRREARAAAGAPDLMRIHRLADREFGLPRKPELSYWRALTAPRPWQTSTDGASDAA
jgi:hypothetical protein